MESIGIFFDLDGTLSDSSEGIYKSLQFALAKKDIWVENLNDLKPFIGPPMLWSFQEYYKMTADEAVVSYQHFQSRYKNEGKFENTLYDGIKELLKSLADRNYVLGVATSKPEVFAKEILSYFGISSYFHIVKGASLDGSLSKKDDILKLALADLRELYPNVERVYMVGDRSYDMLAANALNCVGIGVTYGFGSVEELHENGATHICDTPENISQLLQSLHE